MEMEGKGISVASVEAFTVKRDTNVRRDETEPAGEDLRAGPGGEAREGELPIACISDGALFPLTLYGEEWPRDVESQASTKKSVVFPPFAVHNYAFPGKPEDLDASFGGGPSSRMN